MNYSDISIYISHKVYMYRESKSHIDLCYLKMLTVNLFTLQRMSKQISWHTFHLSAILKFSRRHFRFLMVTYYISEDRSYYRKNNDDCKQFNNASDIWTMTLSRWIQIMRKMNTKTPTVLLLYAPARNSGALEWWGAFKLWAQVGDVTWWFNTTPAVATDGQ